MPLFVHSTSQAKKHQTSMSQEPPSMNTDEALKSHCFSQNPNYFESTLPRRYHSNFSLGSQRLSAQFLMIPNPGFVVMTKTQDTNPASLQSVPTTSSSSLPPKTISKEQNENEEPQWTIRKELTKSDVNYVTNQKLILAKSFVEEHILKNLPLEDSQKIDRGKPGITVKVYDHDTDSEHELCLALRSSYVLKNGWLKTFIQRRDLKKGDEVGLFWECSTSKLHFSVLSRAIAKAPA
ncbi:PREDICTED: putative B3 domain-containing protein At1g78640 [Camelina sativa]|uniref:B3 domain-containing protein At1g78640 n=1 Tax=Camelina sativa TaxID=90675 RepID=A0ABM1QGJ5_CAMSA|nr:PREDICTED: putative B3 domain-containing protein At1g78640 [Camelina sativa]